MLRDMMEGEVNTTDQTRSRHPRRWLFLWNDTIRLALLCLCVSQAVGRSYRLCPAFMPKGVNGACVRALVFASVQVRGRAVRARSLLLSFFRGRGRDGSVSMLVTIESSRPFCKSSLG